MAGVPCKFIRMSGCNMWDGLPETRAGSQCPYCDTDFFSHTMRTIPEIIEQLKALPGVEVQWVWISGGEPMLQLKNDLVLALHEAGWSVAVETNGTVPVRLSIDHLVVSPKVPWEELKQRSGNCLKLLYPHPNPEIRPEAYAGFELERHGTRCLQAIDDYESGLHENLYRTVAKVMELANSGWRLSYQLHKLLGVD